ncbi:hypothetical protein Vadar_026253 [Vaccinium darrowii]|uniref:Uncharacterized protein n=1 Tax=Vaccinium darrowii TaxID=229202 RepID=A0ACB7XCD8_9ERIC|nr:hypothetical protein Vadar_026253 [Vaccinium darrowii]
MASNRQLQRRDPSSSSSHEDAEDAPSKEEAEVSKDDQISTPLPNKPAAQNQPQNPKIKPISSQLVEKDAPSNSAAKHGSHMAKRKASNIEVETAKEKKDGKKRLLFTEGDDIVILEGMIEYHSKTGLEPRSNIKGFLEFVNKSLSFAGATPTQLYEKVRRLQEKYEKNARGENRRVFVKPHEEKVFELSKKIWENNDGGNELGVGLRKEGQKRLRVDMGSVQIVKDGLEVISESKKVELEGKWKQLMVDEIEHYLKKVDLIGEQTMLVLEAMKLYGS